MIRFLLLTRVPWAWQRQCNARVLPVRGVLGRVSSKPALRLVLYRIHSARTVISGPQWQLSIPKNIPKTDRFGAKRTIQNP